MLNLHVLPPVVPVAVVTPDSRLPAVDNPEGRSAQQYGSGAATGVATGVTTGVATGV